MEVLRRLELGNITRLSYDVNIAWLCKEHVISHFKQFDRDSSDTINTTTTRLRMAWPT